MIKPAQAAKANKQPLKIQKPRSVGGRYPWFIDGLKRQLQEDERLGQTRESRTRRLFEGGLRIHTTLDRDMQRAAEQAVARWRPPTGPDIALVAIDPRDGGVRAVVGGRNFKTGAYNVALQGVGRQPGSSYKTFVLAAALDAGISPDSVWESSGFDQLVCGSRWSVDNYEGGGSGPVSVRDATRRSVNGVYGRLMEKLCPDKVAEMAEKLGVSPIADRPGAVDGPWLLRDPPDRHGQRVRHPGQPGRVPQADLLRDGRPPKRQGGDRGGVQARAPGLGRARLAGQRHPQGRGQRGHRDGARHRPSRRRQDRHQPGLPRRLVRRLHPAAGGGGLDGLPRERGVDVQRAGAAGVGRLIPAQVWHDFMAVAMANQEVLDSPSRPRS